MKKRIHQNLTLISLEYIFKDFIFDCIAWPLWWYSKGLVLVGKRFLHFLEEEKDRLGLGIWIKNMFTPMYGQKDIAGVIISFFMRFWIIAFKSFVFLFWCMVIVMLFLLWIALPAYALFQILKNFYHIVL